MNKERAKFDAIIESHYNGNQSDVKAALKKMNRINLIRFVNYMALFRTSLYIDVNGMGELNLFDK